MKITIKSKIHLILKKCNIFYAALNNPYFSRYYDSTGWVPGMLWSYETFNIHVAHGNQTLLKIKLYDFFLNTQILKPANRIISVLHLGYGVVCVTDGRYHYHASL